MNGGKIGSCNTKTLAHQCSKPPGAHPGLNNVLSQCSFGWISLCVFTSRDMCVLDAFDAEKRQDIDQRVTQAPESLPPSSSKFLLPAFSADTQQVLSTSNRVRLACASLPRRLRGGIAASRAAPLRLSLAQIEPPCEDRH